MEEIHHFYKNFFEKLSTCLTSGESTYELLQKKEHSLKLQILKGYTSSKDALKTFNVKIYLMDVLQPFHNIVVTMECHQPTLLSPPFIM